MKEAKLRKLIREEIIKSLLTEKFQSKKLGMLYSKLDSAGKKFFDAAANSMGFDWAHTPDDAITKGANSSNDSLNFFIVTSAKENPYDDWYGSIYPGIIGITKGKKSFYWGKGSFQADNPAQAARARSGTSRKSGTKGGSGKFRQGVKTDKSSFGGNEMVGNVSKKLDNFKRYNQVADEVWSIDTTKIPNIKEMQAARKAARVGALALQNAKKMAEENRHRYRTALAMKSIATGHKGIESAMEEATKLVQKAVELNTKMLTQGQYQDSWSGGYKSVTEKYGRMVDSYVRYKQELAKAGSDDKYDKQYATKQSEYYMKEIQGYFKELKKGLTTVVNKKDVRSIETGRVMAWVK